MQDISFPRLIYLPVEHHLSTQFPRGLCDNTVKEEGARSVIVGYIMFYIGQRGEVVSWCYILCNDDQSEPLCICLATMVLFYLTDL